MPVHFFVKFVQCNRNELNCINILQFSLCEAWDGMGIYNGEKKMTVSDESSRQTFMDNVVEEDRERDGPTSSSTTWRTCGSRWRT